MGTKADSLSIYGLRRDDSVTIYLEESQRGACIHFKVLASGKEPLIELTRDATGPTKGKPLPLIGCTASNDSIVHGRIKAGSRVVVRVNGRIFTLFGRVRDWTIQ